MSPCIRCRRVNRADAGVCRSKIKARIECGPIAFGHVMLAAMNSVRGVCRLFLPIVDRPSYLSVRLERVLARRAIRLVLPRRRAGQKAGYMDSAVPDFRLHYRGTTTWFFSPLDRVQDE